MKSTYMRMRSANNKSLYVHLKEQKESGDLWPSRIWYLSSVPPDEEYNGYEIPLLSSHFNKLVNGLQAFLQTHKSQKFIRSFADDDNRNTYIEEKGLGNNNNNYLSMDDHDKEWLLNVLYEINSDLDNEFREWKRQLEQGFVNRYPSRGDSLFDLPPLNVEWYGPKFESYKPFWNQSGLGGVGDSPNFGLLNGQIIPPWLKW